MYPRTTKFVDEDGSIFFSLILTYDLHGPSWEPTLGDYHTSLRNCSREMPMLPMLTLIMPLIIGLVR